jgi:hypothetical protein
MNLRMGREGEREREVAAGKVERERGREKEMGEEEQRE